MKSILYNLLLLSGILMCQACGDTDQGHTDSRPYTLTGSLWRPMSHTGQATAADSVVTLIIDRHHEVYTDKDDTLPAYQVVKLPVVAGQFSYRGTTPVDADELYLYDSHGHVARLYGTPGATLHVEIDSLGGIHQWGSDTTALHRTLALRDSIPYIEDSLRVRQQLGSMPASAKPEWLMRSINEQLNLRWAQLGKRHRLSRQELHLGDSLFRLPNNKPESVVLFFWSDQIPASIDSLQLLRAIARDYGLYEYADTFAKEKSPTRSKRIRRIDLMSLCVHTSDSSAWRRQVHGLPGKHLVLPGGLAHPLATFAQVDRLPWILILDRFGNYQAHDVWGHSLYEVLDKTPHNTELNRKLNL